MKIVVSVELITDWGDVTSIVTVVRMKAPPVHQIG